MSEIDRFRHRPKDLASALAETRGELTISLEQIAEISERAYRRGFQQGHHAAQTGTPTRDLAKWRHSLNIHKAISPEKALVPFPGWPSAVDRLLIEEDWLTNETSSSR